MDKALYLVDDDIVWAGMVEQQFQAMNESLSRSDRFFHHNPDLVYEKSTGFDVMKPTYTYLISEAVSLYRNAVLLLDASFLSPLHDELSTSPDGQTSLGRLLQRDIHLGVVSGNTEQDALLDIREYRETIEAIRGRFKVNLPWITKPISLEEIMSLQPWNQR